MLSTTCMRCPFNRVRRARHTRYFASGVEPSEILCLRLCDTHQQLFDREFNVWVNVADIVSPEFARAKPRKPMCVRCLRRSRPGEHVRLLMAGEDPQEACRLYLCDSHADDFDVDFEVWRGIADVAETQPAWARTLRMARTEFGDDAAARIRELKERATSRQQRPTSADSSEGEIRLGPLSDQWRFSLHAQQRAQERGFSPAQVLQAATRPDVTAPTTGSNAGPNLFYHVNSDCCAVVNVQKKIIITVYNKFEYLCQISHGPSKVTPQKGIA